MALMPASIESIGHVAKPPDYRVGMSRPTGKSRVTPKKAKPVDGEIRRRKHGDHFHTERWCAHHQEWEPVR